MTRCIYLIWYFICIASCVSDRIVGVKEYYVPSVDTPQGVVLGTITEGGAERFAGIRFAESVVAERRFTRAVLYEEPWEGGILNASRPGPPCIQNPLGDPRPPGHEEAPPPSEDCLFLNIFRPQGASRSDSLPVMVWLFGGGLCGGYASNGFHDGSALANRFGVIVVSVSYRLGALGFLVLDDFDGRDSSAATTTGHRGSGGMNGIYDAVVALRWIQRNIEYFGGRSDDVTLFGQSSGGYATCTLAVAPVSQGLFTRAILQSGPCIGDLPSDRSWGPSNRTYGLEVTRRVMRSLNVTSVEGLRSMPASSVQWPNDIMNFDPYFSGYFDDAFVVPPLDGTSASSAVEARWTSGQVVPSSIMVGFNSKDGTAAFYGSAPLLGNVAPDKPQTKPSDYEYALDNVWGNTTAARVHAQYPLGRFDQSVQSAFIQTDADAYVICPSLNVATLAAGHSVSTWVYEFAHFQPNREVGRSGFGCDNGVELDVVSPTTPISIEWASHGAETHFVFGTMFGADGLGPPNNFTNCSFDVSEAHLSDAMMRYWTNFATKGNPNDEEDDDLPEWVEANVAAGTASLLLRTTDAGGIVTDHDRHTEDCAFWSALFQ